MLNWIKEQIEWFKSFLSEEANGDGKIKKGSSKRIGIFTVLYLFAHSVINNGQSIEWKHLPTISWEWAVMVGGIIGLNILDSYQRRKAELETRIEDRKDEVVERVEDRKDEVESKK